MEGNRRLTASRRHFLLQGGVLATGLVLLGPAPLLAAEKKKGSPQMEVTPTEDLVREHGVLRRLVLIFDEFDRRL